MNIWIGIKNLLLCT